MTTGITPIPLGNPTVIIGDMDAHTLRQILHGILGQPCWRVDFSYGDELRVHLGGKIPRTSDTLKSKDRGEWVLVTKGTPWQLTNPQTGTICCLDLKPDHVDDVRQLLEGGRVMALGVRSTEGFTVLSERDMLFAKKQQPRFLALVVAFDNLSVLTIVPTEQPDPELAHWELFTPANDSLLRIWAVVLPPVKSTHREHV